jgi:hypothetical protein
MFCVRRFRSRQEFSDDFLGSCAGPYGHVHEELPTFIDNVMPARDIGAPMATDLVSIEVVNIGDLDVIIYYVLYFVAIFYKRRGSLWRGKVDFL